MNLLYPKITRPDLVVMLRYATMGALRAGLYGIVHDEITYTISPEYFTRMKFAQFSYADFGLPERLHVAEIGFLATWWVGFIAVWFMARVAVPRWTTEVAQRKIIRGMAIILTCALSGGTTGYIFGLRHDEDYSGWLPLLILHQEIVDIRAFVRVAYIHNASYLGGFIGLVAALLLLKRKRIVPSTVDAA